MSSNRKRSGRRGSGGAAGSIPDSPSSDFEPDDSHMMVVSDEGETGDEGNEGRRTLSPTTIDESMILSDEEEDHRAYGDNVGEDEGADGRHASGGKPASKKIWTSRVKKNHAHPATAASSALMVEDKPWRAASKNRAPAIDVSQPKSPGQTSKHIKPLSNLPPLPLQTTPSEGKKPILKYIRGFGVTSPQQQSPRRPRRPTGTDGTPTGNWSDNDINDDDHSSICSDMISYSSMDSMDDSDDDMSLPLEDYNRHPEQQPGFWQHLPYVPSHFVRDLNAAELSSMVTRTSNTNSTGCLAYLDPEVRELTLKDSSHVGDFLFALDHRFYLRALMQLLAERDEVGVEDSIDDKQNIIKKGPLRKRYLGKAKVKYLELRRGNLTYFGDDDGEGRRTVHLRSATASCNAVDESSTESDREPGATSTSPSTAKAGSSTGGGTNALSAGLTSAVNATTSAASTIAGGTSITAGFELHLWVEGKRYAWLANSKNERQSWVRAIRQAMIGDDDDWGMTLNAAGIANPSVDEGATHEEAMEKCRNLQGSLQSAGIKQAYMETILSLSPGPENPMAAPSLQLPLKCLLDQMPKHKTEIKKDGTSQRQRVKSSIAEFWRSLQSYDFAINGCAIDKESPFAAERIIGSLVRCILDFDRCFAEGPSSDPANMPSLREAPGASGHDRHQQKRSDANRISELDAVSYARSILSLVIKSKTSGDVEFAVENLLRNEKLVKVDRIDPSSALSISSETLHIDVSFAGDDVVDHDDYSPESNEVSGWVKVRRSKYNTWKTRFCVFSEGVFSYYENAEPRPHGLRGQLLLSRASITDVDDEKERAREDAGLYIFRLATKGQERERQFGFQSKEEYLEWKDAIQNELDSCELTKLQSSGAETDEGLRESTSSKKSRGIIEGGSKLISYATDESLKAIKGATGSSMKVVKGGTKVIKDATGAFTKGATNLMFRSIRSGKSRSKRGKSGRSIRRTPSLQHLMEITRTKTGKREPTVQCIIQTTSDFTISSVACGDDETEDTLATVRVKFLQAYLLSGASGRLARGDASIDLDFIDQTNGETTRDDL